MDGRSWYSVSDIDLHAAFETFRLLVSAGADFSYTQEYCYELRNPSLAGFVFTRKCLLGAHLGIELDIPADYDALLLVAMGLLFTYLVWHWRFISALMVPILWLVATIRMPWLFDWSGLSVR